MICEIALSLILLVGASLFVRSFINLRDADVGFDTRPLTTLCFYMTGDAYAQEETRARRDDEIVRRIEALPEVVAAFASNVVPLSGGGVAVCSSKGARSQPARSRSSASRP